METRLDNTKEWMKRMKHVPAGFMGSLVIVVQTVAILLVAVFIAVFVAVLLVFLVVLAVVLGSLVFVYIRFLGLVLSTAIGIVVRVLHLSPVLNSLTGGSRKRFEIGSGGMGP